MFSALKTLDPLDDQGEQGEEGDRDDDEDDVGHQGLLGGLGDGDGASQCPRRPWSAARKRDANAAPEDPHTLQTPGGLRRRPGRGTIVTVEESR